ncbi:unnamed protein product [Tuber melanosporum]|uniref:(Perigord truffle) hypothetical protein n=1 Tax=Tuber melanosporum (strain Mel28) TaxID=656061 RepID=D5GGG3_TUBMM|nr:uncharacterized protein GSTUM_00007373001 [Tuber melanosporum]CAZ83606.1 unnamed protein product [Tuber melanosporum]
MDYTPSKKHNDLCFLPQRCSSTPLLCRLHGGNLYSRVNNRRLIVSPRKLILLFIQPCSKQGWGT